MGEGCKHVWTLGPFKMVIQVPDRYCGAYGYIAVEHCKLCGLLRIPEEVRAKEKFTIN